MIWQAVEHKNTKDLGIQKQARIAKCVVGHGMCVYALLEGAFRQVFLLFVCRPVCVVGLGLGQRGINSMICLRLPTAAACHGPFDMQAWQKDALTIFVQ